MPTTWTLVPVPTNDRQEIEALVATRQRSRNEPETPSLAELHALSGDASDVKALALTHQEVWPAEAFQHLLDDESETAKRFVKAFYLLDRSPGTWLGTDEVAAGTGMTVNAWRSACRGLRKYLDRHYPEVPVWRAGKYEGEKVWPLADVSGRHIGEKDQVYFAVSPAQSAMWRSVAGLSE